MREYARLNNISPPSASKLLNYYYKEEILKKEKDKLYLYFYANKENWLFIDLSRIYWKLKIENSGLINKIKDNFITPKIILFGSLNKAETNENSDIDITIISQSMKKFDLLEFENKLKRKIQIINYKSLNQIKNQELKNNILSGYIIYESW